MIIKINDIKKGPENRALIYFQPNEGKEIF